MWFGFVARGKGDFYQQRELKVGNMRGSKRVVLDHGVDEFARATMVGKEFSTTSTYSKLMY